MKKGHVLLAGDCNSHFGSEEEEIKKSELFGPILYHSHSNNNGDDMFMLCEQFRLQVLTTMLHRSTRVTWSNLRTSSQIDHVLLPVNSIAKVLNLHAFWTKLSTDHKLLTWTLAIPRNQFTLQHTSQPSYTTYYSRTWDMRILLNEEVANNFENCVAKGLKDLPSSCLTWDQICSEVCRIANNLLRKKSQNISSEQETAYKIYQEALRNAMKQRIVDKNPNLINVNCDFPPLTTPGALTLLRDAHKALQKAKKDQSRKRHA